ncbi:MAG: M23 family metallopeptidase, partial [Gammaproteobacteria bacterium]|nr:M23 family metallopeptidase [Gammaproteobacteria bacterium]
TKYAHNSKIFVEPGDLVEKGDVIGLVGSSGRSTGPHVHFEIARNGKSINPAAYIE